MKRKQAVVSGTVISVHPHRVGAQRQLAQVLEVLGGEGHRRYRVRWEDGHESIFFPGEDAVIEPVSISAPAGGSERRRGRQRHVVGS